MGSFGVLQNKTIIAILALFIFATFWGVASTEDLVKFYGADIVFFALFILFLCFTWKFWRLNVPVYTLFVLSFASHLMGIFGWYNVSPLPIQWDHITHGFPLFTFTIFLYNFARPWMTDSFWNLKTFSILLLVFLSGLGVGAIVENIEFAGYLSLGYGEGGLFFGGPGDGVPVTSAQVDVIQEIGGGYINTELDLVWNGFGVFAAMVLMSFLHFSPKKQVP